MSDETFRLLTSSEAVTGYLVGAIALLAAALWWVVARRTAPAAGIGIAVAGVVALDRVYDAPVELLAGLGLLVVAGLVPTESTIATMAMAIPGASLLAITYVEESQPELVVLVVAATVLLGGLVARYDHEQPNGDATTLLVIAFLGVLIIVPDTDFAIVIAAAALPMLVAGYPARFAHLSRGGALAATGLLMWTIASGGAARSGALIAGLATLGILIADPVARMLRGETSPRVEANPLVFLVQGAASIGLAIVVGFAGESPMLIAPVAVGTLVALGLWSVG